MKDQITRCGYRCDLCHAYAPNIKKNDQRETLSKLWKKYYDLDIPASDIYCDGCRCDKSSAKRIDMQCPVRICVMSKGIEHCGVCDQYPCHIFELRRGLSLDEAKKGLVDAFDLCEYNAFLLCYDNKTRLDQIKHTKHDLIE